MLDKKMKQYITFSDGIDYRTISKLMTKAGYKMNHATARNVFWLAINNFLNNLRKNLNEEYVQDLLKEESFHEALADILYLAYNKIKEEENNKKLNTISDKNHGR
jgi:CRISPR/Cas system endoribonuclease Cas6 (RAMP superfamily)